MDEIRTIKKAIKGEDRVTALQELGGMRLERTAGAAIARLGGIPIGGNDRDGEGPGPGANRPYYDALCEQEMGAWYRYAVDITTGRSFTHRRAESAASSMHSYANTENSRVNGWKPKCRVMAIDEATDKWYLEMKRVPIRKQEKLI